MGTEMVLNPQGSYYLGIPLMIGAIFLFIMYLSFLWGAHKSAVVCLIIGAIILGIATPTVAAKYDNPVTQRSYEQNLNRLRAIEEVYKSQPFYLKELSSEPRIQGEIKGNFSGFLFVAGSVYGRIDSGRVITIVYEDNELLIDHYVKVYRVTTFDLDKIAISTIPAGERPYLMYPEVLITTVPLKTLTLRLSPGTPYLFLPEGWKILS